MVAGVMTSMRRWSRETVRREAVGLSERRTLTVLARYGCWLKVASVAVYTVLDVVSRAAGSSRGTASLPVVVVVGGALVGWGVTRLRGYRPAGAWVADAALAAATGASVVVLGAPTAASWQLRVVAVLAVAGQLEWARRPAVAWTVSLAAVTSMAVAAAVGSSGGAGAALPVFVQFALTAVVVVSVRSFVRRIDAVAARTEQKRRDAEVVAGIRAAERLELATLHDTACTTLLMVSGGAAGAGADWLPARARSDLEALRTVPGPVTGTADLADMVDDVLADSAIPVSSQVDGPLTVPRAVASAVLDGLREAVQNVNRHADATTVELRAGRGPDGVWIELCDDGVGFRQQDVPVHCRGISESIVGRMNAAGGTVVVESVVGSGTTVRWSYR